MGKDIEVTETLEGNLKKIVEEIDLDEINWDDEQEVKIEIEESKIYVWIRVYLKDEDPNIEIGDTINIEYEPSGEKIETKFIAYNKKGIDKDIADQIQNYDPEDDKKSIVLMVDEDIVNKGEDIPFLRTLFTFSKHYEEQVYRRTDLVLSIEGKDIILDYYDIIF